MSQSIGMEPSRVKWLVGGLFVAGFLAVWAGNRWDQPRLYSLALLGFGAGIIVSGAESIADLVSAFDDLRAAGYGLQGIWTFLVAAFQVGAGLVLLAGGIAAAVLGWSGLGNLLNEHPGGIVLVVGTAFFGIGLHDLLAIGEPQAKGWQVLARIPFRLAALPAVLIGLALIAVGLFQTLAPSTFHALLTQLLGPFARGP